MWTHTSGEISSVTRSSARIACFIVVLCFLESLRLFWKDLVPFLIIFEPPDINIVLCIQSLILNYISIFYDSTFLKLTDDFCLL